MPTKCTDHLHLVQDVSEDNTVPKLVDVLTLDTSVEGTNPAAIIHISLRQKIHQMRIQSTALTIQQLQRRRRSLETYSYL